MRKTIGYTIFWQLKKSIRSLHFSPVFFLLSQLLWPLILVGTYYLSYSPLVDPAEPGCDSFTGGIDLFSYLVPGIMVIYLYIEYVGLGMGLAQERDYGVLEPVFLSPVNRMLWLFGTALSVLPSGIMATAGFLVSSHLFFGIELLHPMLLVCAVLFVIVTSIPWGGVVCAIFLSGRNSRFLYAVFETPAEFLSGVRFPVTALPSLLSSVAVLYPLSHAVSLMRLCWYEDVKWGRAADEALWLLILAVVYAVVALLLFRRAEARGKRDGTLTFS